MTTEEKAKAYDEAVNKIRPLYEQAIKDGNPIWSTYEYLIPELRESGDERSRKWILEYLYDGLRKSDDQFKEQFKAAIAYLEKQKESHYTKRNALFEKCVENCDPKTVEEVNKRVDDIMNMSELSAFEQALTNFIGYWEDDEERWPSKFVKKHGKHILDMAREELQKEQKHPDGCFTCDEYKKGYEAGRLNGFTAGYNKAMKEQKPAEWSDADNIGWDEAFACVTRAEKAANTEEELQNAVTAEKWLKEIKFKYYVHPVKQEWSEGGGMETINVFRPLAGTSIESAAKQAVNKLTNSGKKFLLAFNGVFLLIDNTKSVQDIVSEYNRSLGGKKKEQGEEEPNDFEITLNDCMLAAQQYPPGKIGWDDVKMWAEELSNYCPQPKQEWDEFDDDCLNRAVWYIENPAPSVVKDTNLVLWLKSLRPQPHTVSIKDATKFGNLEYERGVKDGIQSEKSRHWKPSEEQMEALRVTLEYMPDTFKPRCTLMTLQNDLKKLM